MTPALDAHPEPGDPLAALRGEIDALDDALHDLLMRRAEVVARLAASRVKGAASPLRPGREATILRRLLFRHSGALPPAALVRLWREILCASSAMQGAFSVALPAGDAALEDAARGHFGTMAALNRHPDAQAALDALAEGKAQVAVLPMPAAQGTGAWWTGLDSPRLQVAARLPFYAAAADAGPQAMLVSPSGPDPSGDDRSLLRLDVDLDEPLPLPDGTVLYGVEPEPDFPWDRNTRASIQGGLRDAALPARSLLLARQHDSVLALAEVDGAVAADDPRLSALRARLPLNRAEPLGFYATPVRPPDGGE